MGGGGDVVGCEAATSVTASVRYSGDDRDPAFRPLIALCGHEHVRDFEFVEATVLVDGVVDLTGRSLVRPPRVYVYRYVPTSRCLVVSLDHGLRTWDEERRSELPQAVAVGLLV